MSGDAPFPPPGPAAAPRSSPTTPPPPPPPPPPHGYVAYGTPGTRNPNVSPIKRVATWAIALAVVTCVGSVISALITANLSDQAQDFLDGRISEDEFLDVNALAPLAQIISGVPAVAAGVLGMIWMYRIATNVRALGRQTTFAPVFAILGWFLPPFLFVLPLLVLRELWKASDPRTPPGAEGWRASGENPLLYVWFVVYGIVPLVLTAVSISSVFDALSLDDDSTSLAEIAAANGQTEVLLSGAFSVIGAVVWVLLIRRFTARHCQLTGET